MAFYPAFLKTYIYSPSSTSVKTSICYILLSYVEERVDKELNASVAQIKTFYSFFFFLRTGWTTWPFAFLSSKQINSTFYMRRDKHWQSSNERYRTVTACWLNVGPDVGSTLSQHRAGVWCLLGGFQIFIQTEIFYSKHCDFILTKCDLM